jgi:adenosine deaminase
MVFYHARVCIGHGVRLTQNKFFLEKIARNKIPIESCVTSNLHTHSVQNIKEHPLPLFLKGKKQAKKKKKKTEKTKPQTKTKKKKSNEAKPNQIAGIRVVPCTDDFTMSEITLSSEYELIQKSFDFNAQEIYQLIEVQTKTKTKHHKHKTTKILQKEKQNKHKKTNQTKHRTVGWLHLITRTILKY